MAGDPEIEAAFGSAPAAQAQPIHTDDPEIAAAFGTDGQAATGAHAHRDLHQTTWRQALGWTSHGNPGQQGDMPVDTEGDIGAGKLATSGNFWRGIGRGMLNTYFGSENNRANVREGPNGEIEHIQGPTPGEQEAHGIAQRLSMTGGADTPEGQAGEVVGGIFGPSPFNAAPAGVSGRAPAGSPQSISAAAAAPNLSAASPELRAAVAKAKSSGAPVNNEVLTRHLQAESLPIPQQLTKGQATRDSFIWSEEQNQRAHVPDVESHLAEQNQGLVDNLRHFREETVAPDVHSTDVGGHADNIIDAYKAKDAAAQADINGKYQALRDAAGGEFPVDTQALQQNVQTSLKKGLLTKYAPAGIMGDLEEFANSGKMSLEDFEALRTNLADLQRSSSDGLTRRAAGTIREELEKLPLQGNAATLKGLADQARSAARARFQALDADPAYKAAVGYNEESPGTSISSQRFAQRFVTGASPEQISLMRKTLADSPVATQSIGAIGLDNLRQAAGVEPDFSSGTFGAERFGKAWDKLGPKQRLYFSADQAEGLQNLVDTARNMKVEPAGGHTNFSRTHVAAVSAGTAGAKELAASAAEHAANRAVPFSGTIGRAIGGVVLKGRRARAFAAEHLQPGAGLDYAPEAAGK